MRKFYPADRPIHYQTCGRIAYVSDRGIYSYMPNAIYISPLNGGPPCQIARIDLHRGSKQPIAIHDANIPIVVVLVGTCTLGQQRSQLYQIADRQMKYVREVPVYLADKIAYSPMCEHILYSEKHVALLGSNFNSYDPIYYCDSQIRSVFPSQTSQNIYLIQEVHERVIRYVNGICVDGIQTLITVLTENRARTANISSLIGVRPTCTLQPDSSDTITYIADKSVRQLDLWHCGGYSATSRICNLPSIYSNCKHLDRNTLVLINAASLAIVDFRSGEFRRITHAHFRGSPHLWITNQSVYVTNDNLACQYI